MKNPIDLAAQAAAFADKYNMLPQGSTVLCALSGGADSMALLSVLEALAKPRSLTLHAAHFNHQLRGEESRRDEAFVRRFVAQWCGPAQVDGHELPGVPLYVGRGDVAAQAGELGRGLEETAREMRYAFLRETAAELGGALIATAHTADDNGETILLHLLRGSGLRGLTGIRPVGEGLIRPMLTTTRAQVEEYLRLYGLPHVEDSSNQDTVYARNRLRQEVMPVLREWAQYYLRCQDEVTFRAMCRLAHPGPGETAVVSGESGASGMGAFLAVMDNPDYRKAMGFDENSVVLLFSTEGDTDPGHYKEVVSD